MITKIELEEYAKIRNLRNMGYAEKDYFQIVILFILSQGYRGTLIFKGGTALNKCYGLNRFSEDLDFTCSKDVDFKIIENGLKRFKLDFELKKEQKKDSISGIIRIKGPLYSGIRNSMCKLALDFSLRETVILKPELKTIGRFLEEVPSFDVLVMQEKEIVSEKVRAIMTRNKARDVYDLHFLLKKEIVFDIQLIEAKLKYYGKKWDKKEFISKLNDKKNIWDSELKQIVNNPPNINVVIHDILSYLP